MNNLRFLTATVWLVAFVVAVGSVVFLTNQQCELYQVQDFGRLKEAFLRSQILVVDPEAPVFQYRWTVSEEYDWTIGRFQPTAILTPNNPKAATILFTFQRNGAGQWIAAFPVRYTKERATFTIRSSLFELATSPRLILYEPLVSCQPAIQYLRFVLLP